jgi:hypothetical protein
MLMDRETLLRYGRAAVRCFAPSMDCRSSASRL